ncbi:hypothetical protein BJ508DRAFT_416622 [Ascobolus immersus RN42]|uniref:Extracellular membrane protein CFEM domain-containing protein n=1 Tax=Ascobolus immersus RN42 TaxID=1160509 RepID=A0A3N4HWQ4_ASCIM|nr:hypothetical protein BJ508DRAFT_416622 [Ascobolus immersus RN42]
MRTFAFLPLLALLLQEASANTSNPALSAAVTAFQTRFHSTPNVPRSLSDSSRSLLQARQSTYSSPQQFIGTHSCAKSCITTWFNGMISGCPRKSGFSDWYCMCNSDVYSEVTEDELTEMTEEFQGCVVDACSASEQLAIGQDLQALGSGDMCSGEEDEDTDEDDTPAANTACATRTVSFTSTVAVTAAGGSVLTIRETVTTTVTAGGLRFTPDVVDEGAGGEAGGRRIVENNAVKRGGMGVMGLVGLVAAGAALLL